MIEKFIRIMNLGRFQDVSPGARETSFQRLNLVFSHNGRGKTTLASIFRSLKTGEPSPVLERRTLGQPDEPRVELRGYGRNVTFRNGSWSEVIQEIEVLDRDFVEENVYSGSKVEIDQRKNLYRFAIGAKGVALAKQVDDVAERIAQERKKIRDVEGGILLVCNPFSLSVDDFLRLPVIPDIEGRISEVRSRLEALAKADQLRKAEGLKPLTVELPDLAKFRTLMATSVDTVARDAEKKVREHVATCLGPEGEPWLSTGFHFIKADDRCPFCGQDLATSALAGAYRVYFTRGYQDLQDQIAKFRRSVVEQRVAGRPGFSEAGRHNARQGAFWKPYIDGDAPVLGSEDFNANLDKALSKIDSLLGEKVASPLSDLSGDSRVIEVDVSIRHLQERLDTYNSGVDAFNRAVQARKAAMGPEQERQAKIALNRLEATVRRHRPDVEKLRVERETAQRQVIVLEKEKLQARKELEAHADEVMQKYQATINRVLDCLGAEFSIVSMGTSLQSGRPSAGYAIEINGEAVKPSVPGKGASVQPSFGNTLSDGDRTSLAFAFFVARLKDDPELDKKILVFDDPVASLDRHRRRATEMEIVALGRKATQTFVFSHDPDFLREVRDELAGVPSQEIQIAREGRNTSDLSSWDADKECESPYFKQRRCLVEFVDGDRQSDLRAIAQCLRTVLEHNLRFRFPDFWEKNEWLGDFVGKVQGATSPPLNVLPKDELAQLNAFCKRYHHSNPRYADELVVEDELRTWARRTLTFVTR